MTATTQHPVYGEIVYTESFWTGKKTLTVNQITAVQASKNKFTLDEKSISLKGSFYTGVTLHIENEKIQISPKAKWYEILLAVIPLVFLLTWGNNPTLCAIFPVIGGAIGGFLGGVAFFAALSLMRKANSIVYKILIGFGVCIASILVSFALALIVLSAL